VGAAADAEGTAATKLHKTPKIANRKSFTLPPRHGRSGTSRGTVLPPHRSPRR
jgi:hypothetical protein